jgi:hypothetical protein
VQQFQHGQSNPTFLLDLPGCPQRMVLRKQPPGKLLASAHAGVCVQGGVAFCQVTEQRMALRKQPWSKLLASAHAGVVRCCVIVLCMCLSVLACVYTESPHPASV